MFRAALLAGLLAISAACSAGRYYAKDPVAWMSPRDQRYRGEIKSILDDPGPAACGLGDTANPQNTVFVHPGLHWFFLNWDFSLAKDAGLLLVQEGLAGAALELRDRNGDRMRERMLSDSGTRFIGLHYSMGGMPKLVKSGIQAAQRATLESGRPIHYSPILVDPVALEALSESLDMNAPQLGELFVVVSHDYSYLRPDIRSASRRLLTHAKTHILYAEDFGATWGHFGFLSDVTRTADGAGISVTRARELFNFIARAIVGGMNSTGVQAGLAYYKVKYTSEDGRPLATEWLDQAQGLVCRPGPDGGQALLR